ncbi:MAG TPA: hypothetical protein VGW11_04575 [Solirubrobacteraceae bacterium]|nr:hypothetical protein [Solirubrobacteraceae bacterium]
MPSLPVVLVLVVLVAPVLVAVHEAGHALAALVLTRDPVDVVVGSEGRAARLRVGRVMLALHPFLRPDRMGGSVGLDDAALSARGALAVALAGPAASSLGTVATALALERTAPGLLHDVLAVATLGGLMTVAINLVPMRVVERRGEPPWRTDGLLALEAVRALRWGR